MICPLCHASQTNPLFLKDGASFNSCLSCGFKFAWTAKNANFQSSLDDYEDAYIQYLENNAADEKNFQSILSKIGEHTDVTKGSLLDIGCGTGKFVRYLRSKSIDASGIEPSIVLFDRYLSSETYFQNETVERVSAKGGMKWSVITVTDVLEHVAEPRVFMDALASVLTAHGSVFIETVDAGSWLARFLGRQWHFYNKYHLSYFSWKTLALLCEVSGFEIESFERPTVYFPLGYVMRYAAGFGLPRKVSSGKSVLDRICVPLNIGDRFRACLRKKERVSGK